MTPLRRSVRRSGYFVEVAQEFFPPGGSTDGRPSFARFEEGPLRAIEDLCALDFESMTEIEPGIRAWTTVEAPFFPPMTFFALLDTAGVVELVDLLVDSDYDWRVDDEGER